MGTTKLLYNFVSTSYVLLLYVSSPYALLLHIMIKIVLFKQIYLRNTFLKRKKWQSDDAYIFFFYYLYISAKIPICHQSLSINSFSISYNFVTFAKIVCFRTGEMALSLECPLCLQTTQIQFPAIIISGSQ